MVEDITTTALQIRQMCYGNLSGWYSKKESGDYPPAYINVDTVVNVGATSESNLFVKVASQPTLWTYEGDIPCLIRNISGISLIIKNLTQEKGGSFIGTVAAQYAINIDDRIIDHDLNEYKVDSVKASQSGTFKTLGLTILP